jgi:ATP-dependent Clp protease ATP-binding subunit ClpA
MSGKYPHAVLEPVVLQPEKRSPEVVEFEKKLKDLIVGQDEAVSTLVNVYQAVRAGMASPGRPTANLLLLGPTGSGKTRLVEAAAEILFSSTDAMIKIDCAEFQHSHEISKLIGSPPGYIGHRETSPVLTQAAIDRFHTDKLKLTFLLFDEIEKASDALWQLLLGILDKGTVTLGDNRKVDLSRTIIIMTSNLGASEMTRLMTGSIGFAPQRRDEESAQLDQKISRVAVDAARKRFSPEFMNRIDKVIVFRALTRKDIEKILDIELNAVQSRILSTQPDRSFFLMYTPKAKELLLSEGIDLKYGARHLKRAIERHLVLPISSLMSTDQIVAGDRITVDLAANGKELAFLKMPPLSRGATNGSGTSGPVLLARAS